MLEHVEMSSEPVTLEQRVHRRIQERTGSHVRKLRVVIADGRVVVAGQTRSYYAKQLVVVAALDALKNQSHALAINIDVD